MELKEELKQAKEEGFVVELTTDFDIQGHWATRTLSIGEYCFTRFRYKSAVVRWLMKNKLL